MTRHTIGWWPPESAQQVLELVDDDTHLVHLSTSHATGLTGSVSSVDVADYRNPYEWSKAACERLIHERPTPSTIVRFPTVFGRRTDGRIERISNFYKLFPALAGGLLPAIIGLPNALLDMVPVDDIAARIASLVRGPRPDETTTIALGRGSEAPRVSAVIDHVFEALSAWRDERGVPPLEQPPLLAPERWHRFFLPFAREHLSPLQLRTIDVFGGFTAYFSILEPFPVTDVVDDVVPVIERCVRWWADTDPKRAAAIPEPWALLPGATSS